MAFKVSYSKLLLIAYVHMIHMMRSSRKVSDSIFRQQQFMAAHSLMAGDATHEVQLQLTLEST